MTYPSIVRNSCWAGYPSLVLMVASLPHMSFVAGKETVKYIVSVFCIMFNGVCNNILDYFIANEIINTLEKRIYG